MILIHTIELWHHLGRRIIIIGGDFVMIRISGIWSKIWFFKIHKNSLW